MIGPAAVLKEIRFSIDLMLNDEEKSSVQKRLRRVEGQVAGIGRMVERGEYCVDTLLQIAAARAALARVGRIVLESHVQGCVRQALTDGNEDRREKMLTELLNLFDQYGDLKQK